MAYGKNGSMCWLAGAVRTLQKRVELLEAATNDAKCKDDDLHDFNQILSDDLCVPRQKTVQVMEKTIEIPQLHSLEQIVDAPEIQTLQSSTTFQLHMPWWMGQSSKWKLFPLVMCPSRRLWFDPAMAYRAPETMMTLPATTPLVHAADMTSPATTLLVHAADMKESGLYSDDIKLVMLHGNCSRSEAVSASRANNNDLIEAILCLEKEETVMQAMNSDIIETSEKRTLRISPVVDTPESQTLQCTEGLDTAPDLEKAPAKRTLSIPLADIEKGFPPHWTR